jgi:hypothetical protein
VVKSNRWSSVDQITLICWYAKVDPMHRCRPPPNAIRLYFATRSSWRAGPNRSGS